MLQKYAYDIEYFKSTTKGGWSCEELWATFVKHLHICMQLQTWPANWTESKKC